MRIKKASKDFNVNDLPSNRIEVFKDCLKVRFGSLIKCGLVSFIFFIPLLVGLIIRDFSYLSMYESYSGGSITADEFQSYYYTTKLIFDIFSIVASIILSIGVAGMTRVIRQIAWEEPVFFQKDFFDGIKMNGGFIILATLILDLAYVSSDLVYYSNIEQELIRVIPYGGLFAIVIPVYLFNLSQINVYNMKFIKATKNSMIFYIKAFPRTLLFMLVIALSILVKYISNLLIVYIALVIIIIILMPIFYLAWFLHSARVFDELINVNEYPEIVDKGIVRKPGYKKLEPTRLKSMEELRKEIEEENKELEKEENKELDE